MRPSHPPFPHMRSGSCARTSGSSPPRAHLWRWATSASPRAPSARRSSRELRTIAGTHGVGVGHRDRVEHAAGKGYPDLVLLREGRPDGAPDAVVWPSSHAQVRALLELCARRSIAVVPFGGGTSVVGGIAPVRGAHSAVISLDMGRMRSVVSLDRDSRTVSVQAGMRAPALEEHLAGLGLTLGHYPQSFEYVSLGGCAATRSAGQASTGYGAIADMVLGMRLAAPRAATSTCPRCRRAPPARRCGR